MGPYSELGYSGLAPSASTGPFLCLLLSLSPVVQIRETELQRTQLLTVKQPSAEPGFGPHVTLKPVLVTAQFRCISMALGTSGHVLSVKHSQMLNLTNSEPN